MANDVHNPLNTSTADVPSGSGASPNTDAPQDDMFTEFLAESGLGVAPEAPVDATPKAPEPSPGAPPPPPPVAPPPPPESTAPAPLPPVKFAYNGNFYTLEELAQQGLLTEALQKATQLDTQRANTPAPAETPQSPPAPLSAKELHRQMAPMVEELVTQGFIEADLPDLYPAMTASMVSLYQQVGALRQAMQSMVQFYGQQQQQSQVQQVSATLNSAIDATVKRGGLYQSLTDETTQKGFRNYLWELNPMVSQLTPEFVARQYVSYIAGDDAVLTKLQQQLAAQRQPAAAGPPPAAPPTRGSARQPRTPVPDPEEEPWADMMEGLLR